MARIAPRSAPGKPRRALSVLGDLALIAVVGLLAWVMWPSTLGGCTTITIVSGHSMEPTYYTGDLVISRCGQPGIGDVVVYQPAAENGARVIHRIVGGTAEAGWRVQGDNNDFTDPWTPRGEEILGIARLHVAHAGSVAAILLSPMTWTSILVLGAALLVWPARDATDEVAEPDQLEDADARGSELLTTGAAQS
ncbi:signal peptidase I [Cellulomonas sp. 179-A 4D5 NHS]|uniref:signal peptidase I n=1 Tax=Cellulomonas sp. 179-A 4D5 NHS TaxID=3142378 RepID=UPI0039A3F315